MFGPGFDSLLLHQPNKATIRSLYLVDGADAPSFLTNPLTPFALFATLITANKGAFKRYLSNSIQFNVITFCILI